MTIKIKFGILVITTSILLILLVYTASVVPGFSQNAPTLYIPALAQSSDPSELEPLILTDDQEEYPLGLHLEILEDPNGEFTIDEVSSPEFDSQFVPSQVEVPNYGFTDSVYWVRLRLYNETRQIDEWLLEQEFANTHYIDLYTPLQDGGGFEVKQTGALRPVSTRDVLDPNIVFNLNLPNQSQQTYYLRFQNGASMTLPLTLWTQDAFLIQTQLEQAIHWLYFGAIIALLVYHLFLLFTLREASYLYFVILLASVLVEELSYVGYLEVYIIPNLYYLKPLYYPVSFILMIATIVLFSDTFLELRTRFTKLHWINIVLLAGWGVLILLTPFTSYHNIAVLAIPWALVSLITTWIAGIASWRQGFHPARFFMIAWFGMIACLSLVILVRLGIAPSTIFSENLYRLGMVWMAVGWSIALADRINLLKSETDSANRDLRTSEHRLSQILEGLPLGVILYGKDQKPRYTNQRMIELFSNPSKGIRPDLSGGRTLAQAISYFSLRVAGSSQEYPLEKFPVFTALHGEPASADDIEMDRGDELVPLEIQASPVWDDAGDIDSAVVAIQDITQRKQAEAELVEYHKHLEELVRTRTAELTAVNEQLNLHIDWLSAINKVNQVLVTSADFQLIYEKILEIINKLFSTQDSFIAALDARRQQLQILAHSCHSDLHPDLNGSITSVPDPYLSDPNTRQGNLTLYPIAQLSSLSGPLGMHIQVTPIHTIALVPLLLRESILGFLGLEMHDTDRNITRDEISLLHIFAIDIAQLFEEERLYEQTKALITTEERNRLARDLHDSVTQVLFSITLLADVLPQIWRRDPEQGLQRLEKLRQLTRGALAEMRTMLLELRPSAVINTPLGDLLAQLTEAIASRSGLPFQFFIEQIPPLPENVQTTFYRIAQEALNNVVKHAQANHVTVSLSATQLHLNSSGEPVHEIRLEIQDDGVGFLTGEMRSDHMGINVLRERATAIQAHLSLESSPGYGTQVTLVCCNDSGSL